MGDKYNRIILFCDYGVDDAVATLHILSHADMFGAIDIAPIGGNVSVETAYRNAHTLLAAYGGSPRAQTAVCRYSGDTRLGRAGRFPLPVAK